MRRRRAAASHALLSECIRTKGCDCAGMFYAGRVRRHGLCRIKARVAQLYLSSYHTFAQTCFKMRCVRVWLRVHVWLRECVKVCKWRVVRGGCLATNVLEFIQVLDADRSVGHLRSSPPCRHAMRHANRRGCGMRVGCGVSTARHTTAWRWQRATTTPHERHGEVHAEGMDGLRACMRACSVWFVWCAWIGRVGVGVCARPRACVRACVRAC